MRLIPDMLQGLVCFFLHSLLCLLWGVYPADAGNRGGGGSTERDCPKQCFCNKLNKIVYCSRRGLSYIPNDIPENTLQLNMKGNTLQTTLIQRSNFSRLLNLEHLYLSECGIETIEVDTFRDLVNLQWLDLSVNRIKVIQPDTFRGLNLRFLFLNGNRDLSLSSGSFEGLVTSGLYLHECSIKKLNLDVLSPLNTTNTLRYLWLNGNELERVVKGFSTIFESLSHLRLGSNPLHCNCEVVWLKEFFDNHQDVFEGAIAPSCLTPPKLRGKFFSELSVHDLTCQRPVFNNIDANIDHSHARLKCSASGDPVPTLYWIQPSGVTSKYAAPKEDINKNQGILNITGDPEHMDQRSGMYICVANNDAGNVTLTINVTWPRARTTHHRVSYKTITPTSNPTMAVAKETFQPTGNGAGHTPTDPAPVGGTSKTRPSSSQRDQRRTGNSNYGGKNYTALNMLDFSIRRGERLFNLTELIGAVIGTHVCTLLLCLILMPIYYRRKMRQHNTNSLEKKKPPPPEKLYLNGMGHHPMDYLETPSSSPKR